jgi:Zn-dependent protease
MIDIIFYVVILIMSVVLHEVAHGYAALYFGDRTAKDLGRLTLNPIPHLDPIGSIALPALLAIMKSPFMIGWAKPVPYDPRNFHDVKKGTLAVASAGVFVNFVLAIFFGLILRFAFPYFPDQGLGFILSSIVIINIALGIFNLIPVPPLDGSKILFALLPNSFANLINTIEQYSLIIFLIFVFFLSDFLGPVISFLFTLITGYGL